ncbi:hypothetical protein J6590_002734 [Homalodisca vitripennis]|nr:hypothetical protein J6590_002734 [Homalodisca vitripennis]
MAGGYFPWLTPLSVARHRPRGGGERLHPGGPYYMRSFRNSYGPPVAQHNDSVKWLCEAAEAVLSSSSRTVERGLVCNLPRRNRKYPSKYNTMTV